MTRREKQIIEIEKTHRNPLPSFNQAVTSNCPCFLGTALITCKSFRIKFFAHPRALNHFVSHLCKNHGGYAPCQKFHSPTCSQVRRKIPGSDVLPFNRLARLALN